MLATNSIRARPVLRELRRSRSDAEHPAFQVPSLNLDSTLEVQMPEIATVERTVHNELPDLQQRTDVGDRKQAVAAIDGGGERSERVSPAALDGLHSVASAGTTASWEGRRDARDSEGFTRVASTSDPRRRLANVKVPGLSGLTYPSHLAWRAMSSRTQQPLPASATAR